MFGSLLGRKFSNKCKHSVKCIRCRIETIRKKKQAMVRYLKKDVADLVAGGHDANAFGRMDALIVEINHVSCYDMMEQYCICILEHLSTLQKERVCPEETVEPVATLIFAAARFSDLPELVDLRCVFVERYGTYMEAYINAEFVEKLLSKTFSKDKKLQFMHDIAEEFLVNWDIKAFGNNKAFGNKLSNQSPPTSDHSVKHMSSSNGNKKQSISNGERQVTDRQNEVINGRKPELSRTEKLEAPSPAIIMLKKPSSVNSMKNIEIIKEDQKIIHEDRYEHRSKGDLQKQQVEVINGRKLKLNRTEKLEARSIIMPKTPSSVKSIKSIEIVKKQDQTIIHTDRYEHGSKNDLQKQQVQAKEPRDLLTKIDSMFDKSAPHVKTKGNQSRFQKNEEIFEETAWRRSESVHEGLGLINTEKQTVAEVVSREVKAVNMVPPYTKPNAHHSEFVDFTNPEVIKKTDRNGEARRHSASANSKTDNRDFHLKPPYIKPNVTKTPSETGFVKQYEISNIAGNGDFPRRKHLDDQDAILQQLKQKDDIDIDFSIENGRRMSRMLSEQQRQGRQGDATFYDADYDEEEEIVDKLLKHYSKKIGRNEPRKAKILDKPHPTTRAVSLPPEPAIPAEKSETVVSAHMRAASMQPDHMSPNGGRVYPRLPDYKELAARIAALTRP